MSLTDEQKLQEMRNLAHLNKYTDAFCLELFRAIESAATAPMLERIAAMELDEQADQAEIERLERGIEFLTAQAEAAREELEALRKDAADADGMCKALAAVIDKDDVRWKFLHTTNKDAEGFEWCVMRVKWENGRISEAWHTNQDLKDLDAAIDAAMKTDPNEKLTR